MEEASLKWVDHFIRARLPCSPQPCQNPMIPFPLTWRRSTSVERSLPHPFHSPSLLFLFFFLLSSFNFFLGMDRVPVFLNWVALFIYSAGSWVALFMLHFRFLDFSVAEWKRRCTIANDNFLLGALIVLHNGAFDGATVLLVGSLLEKIEKKWIRKVVYSWKFMGLASFYILCLFTFFMFSPGIFFLSYLLNIWTQKIGDLLCIPRFSFGCSFEILGMKFIILVFEAIWVM